jgi:cytosine/adenosine deaminase-related metal-dependent hydrolase
LARIYTAKYLLPIDAPPLIGGALLEVDGQIAALGPLADLRRANPAVEVVEFADAIIAPLLVNAHTHLELSDFPDWAAAAGETEEPDSFVDWILRLVRIKRTLSRKQYAISMANGIERSIAAGTGAVGDIVSQYPNRKAYLGSSLHGVIYLESLGQDPEIISHIKHDLRSILTEAVVGQLRLGLSPHSPYTISGSYLGDIYSKCQQEGLPCCTHLAESAAEVKFIEQSGGDLATRFYPGIGWEYLVPKASGKRPAKYLQQHGGLFPGNLLVHGVQLNADEIKLLAATQMSLALCPRSNARLKVGKAPVAELQAAGIRLALGTDSLASNDSLSLWDEMAFAHRWFEGALDAPTLLQMATLNGAQVLGVDPQLGSLTTGKLASFQVLQPDSTVVERELLDFLVAPGRTEEIVQVYHQGVACLSGLH